ALRITFDLVEQKSREFHSTLILVDNHSELDVTIGSNDLPQFSRGIDHGYPVTKILNRHDAILKQIFQSKLKNPFLRLRAVALALRVLAEGIGDFDGLRFAQLSRDEVTAI